MDEGVLVYFTNYFFFLLFYVVCTVCVSVFPGRPPSLAAWLAVVSIDICQAGYAVLKLVKGREEFTLGSARFQQSSPGEFRDI